MNILIVHPCKGFYGGAEEVVVQLYNYLRSNGHEVRIIVKNAPDQLEQKHTINCVSWIDLWEEVQRGYCSGQKGQTHLEWADVVNVHNAPVPLMTFPKKVPTVYMCNEPMELFTNWKRKPIEAFNRWWVKKSGMKVVVADKFNAERFEGIYKIKPTMVPYGIDCEFWSKGNHSQRDKTLRLLQVGTISPFKNQLASIETLRHLLRDGIDASLTFVVIGNTDNNDYYEHLLNKVREYELYHKVSFVTKWSKELVRDYYCNSDILLHPIKGQGGWLVPFEAICARLPVVTSMDFTARDIIVRRYLGFITKDYVSTIKHIHKYYSFYEKKTIEQREWVKGNLTWEKFGEGMVKVFEEVRNGER